MRKKKSKVLVVCSGGLDSTVALWWARQRYARVGAITFSYGANHNGRERSALKRICAASGIRLDVISLPIGKHFKSSLLSGAQAIPEGHYAAKSMKSTIVPFRNGIMLSFAAGYAESHGYGAVILGNHSGDHFIYPDCRPAFIGAISEAIWYGTMNHVRVVSPFCDMTKDEIVALGDRLGAPLELTYSCYKGGRRHCGKCGTCVERKEAFAVAGVPDPTEYETK